MAVNDKTEAEATLIQALNKQDDKLTEKLEELKKEFKEIMHTDTYNLDGEIIRTIGNKQRFISMLNEEKSQLVKLKRTQRALYGDLYEKYKFNHNVKLDNRHEIEQWINRNPKYQVYDTVIENQEIVISYIDSIIKSLNSKEFSLRNLIDLKKLEKY